jgi:glycosyltransferase involved in cell wall biosynthesis
MKSAVCLIVRNEARDIGEWIAYHGAIGFDTQIIFNNCSDDGTGPILASASRFYDLRLHDWKDSTAQFQTSAYDAALKAYRQEFDWMAFIDSDEFLVINDNRKVNDFLAAYEPWSGIALPWAVYGANGHEDFPDKLVIESFTRRAGADFFPARHTKTILRPGFARATLNPHCFDLDGNRAGSYCDPLGRTIAWHPAPEHGGVLPGFVADPPDYSVARINHYFTRSRAHWLEKLRRGYRGDLAIRKMAEFDEYNRNDIDDPIATRAAAAVRAGLARIRRPL